MAVAINRTRLRGGSQTATTRSGPPRDSVETAFLRALFDGEEIVWGRALVISGRPLNDGEHVAGVLVGKLAGLHQRTEA